MKIKIPLSVTILVDYDVTDVPDPEGSLPLQWMIEETAASVKAVILDHMTSDETVDRMSDTVGWCINGVSVSVD